MPQRRLARRRRSPRRGRRRPRGRPSDRGSSVARSPRSRRQAMSRARIRRFSDQSSSALSSCSCKNPAQLIDDPLDLVLGRTASEAEADSAHADLGSDAHGLKDRRQRNLTGMASRAGRSGDIRHLRQDLGADMAGKRDVERIRQMAVGMAVEGNAVAESGAKTIPEQVAEALCGRHADPGLSNLAGFAEACRQQRALRAGAPPALVSGAVDQGLDRNPATDVEGAYALRRVDLVAGDREQIDAELLDFGRYLADGLRRVRMQRNPVRAGDFGDFSDRLDRADLVVRVHDADQERVLGDRLADVIGVDKAAPVDGNVGHGRTKSLKKPAWRYDRGMLDLRGDDVRRSIAA